MNFLFITSFSMFLFLSQSAFAQCPIPGTCTITAVAGTNYTVNAGQTLCIQSPLNYNNFITLNGGTVYVAAGATLSQDIFPTSTSTVNICGTLSGTRQFNDKTNLNYYGTADYTVDMRNGLIVNNYSTVSNVTLTGMDNVNTKTLNNFGVISSLNIINWNQPLTINNSNTLTVKNTVGTIKDNSVINNTGTLNWTSQLVSNAGVQINNSGTFNATSASAANLNSTNLTNSGTITFAQGPVFQGTSSTATNSGTFNVTAGQTTISNTQFTNTSTGTMNTKNLFIQNSGTLTNNGTLNVVGELRPDATFTMGTRSTTNVTTFYKNASGTVNMNNLSLLNISNNIPVWDGSSINLISGCASVFASTNTNNTINGFPVNNPNLNFCGSAPADAAGCTLPIASLANNGSGLFRITLTSCGVMPTNLQYVQIYGATYTALNGIWQVIYVSPNTYDLVASTYNAAATTAGSHVISEQSKLKIGSGTYLGYSSCANPCSPLPLSLISFNGTYENGSVKLVWQTSEQATTDYFLVERSIDGINFELVSEIDANRNNGSIQTYTQFDVNPLSGTTYYKLIQVNLDGSQSDSPVIAVNNTTDFVWIVFPNPSSINSGFVISTNIAEAEFISIAIIDVTGNIVHYYGTKLYETEIAVRDLAAGLYVVTLQTTSDVQSKKIIIK